MRSIFLTLTLCFVLTGTALSQPPPLPKAKTIEAPQPVFPVEAKDPIYGYSVTVWIDVNKQGKVTGARAWGLLVPCSNRQDKAAAAINKAALDAAKATVFEPIEQEGEPVEVTLNLTYPLHQTPLPEGSGKLINGGVINRKAISLPEPPYPPQAKANRVSGSVTVQILVAEDGKVLSAAAISGHPYLHQSSVDAACQARFSEFRLGGQLVKVSGILMYNFVP